MNRSPQGKGICLMQGRDIVVLPWSRFAFAEGLPLSQGCANVTPAEFWGEGRCAFISPKSCFPGVCPLE